LSSSVRTAVATAAGDDAFLLFDEREQQMLRLDLGMPFAIGQLLRGKDGFLCFLGVLVDVHDQLPASSFQLPASSYFSSFASAS
jgi:hypothetical protein